MKLFGIFISIALLFLLGGFFFLPGNSYKPFVIESGESTASIIRKLEDVGVVRSAFVFRVVLRLSNNAANLQPGTYDLSQVKTYNGLIRTLASGGINAREFTLLIKEGYSIRDIHAALKLAEVPAADDFLSIAGRPAVINGHKEFRSEFSFLESKPSRVNNEGFLFPDTYRFFRDASAEDITRTLLKNFDRRVNKEIREKIEGSGMSLFEVVTLASVIEKEVRGDQDRRKVADIFLRRLAVGMGLEADSTVNYVTGKHLPAVTIRDTRVDSLYNTYKYRGLPPGPISNPGISAIAATVSPEKNPYWFFLTDKDGNVHYATTFEEHKRNKQKYL